MSLRTKFAILVSLLAFTICGSMAIALWSFGLQRSQLLGPYANTPDVVDRLRLVGRSVEDQAAVLRADAEPESSPPLPPPTGERTAQADARLRRFDEASVATNDALAFLARQGAVGAGAGGTIASRTLAQRVEEFQAGGRRALLEGSPEALLRGAAGATEIRTLVDGLSYRVLLESVRAIEGVESVRRKLLFSVLWAFLASALMGTLGLFLLHRWVVSPVATLRTAANRIAAGEFRHRIPADGKDELAQLARDVNHMASTIEGMLNERVERERLAAVGEMVRRLAHNLRNPLAGIRGLAELARDELTMHPELRDSQERIIASVDRFERWLAELLGVTRPLSVNPEKSSVEPLLAGLLDAHRPMARTKEITLELDAAGAPAQASFDVRQLEHSLVAILTNAIQAAPHKSTVRIEAQALAGTGDWEVRICDQGPGVAPEIIDKVFNAYFTTKRDGNGIGLAIAQQVVRAHGGRITIRAGARTPDMAPGAGPGATFVVRMPITPPQMEPPDRQGAHGRSAPL